MTKPQSLLVLTAVILLLGECSAQLSCASTSGSVAEYEANDIKLSDVVYCSYAHRSKSMIIIRSFNTTYIDTDYPAHQGISRQPSVLIIAPNLEVQGTRKFNLQGSTEDFIPVPGKPGGRGTTKGSPGKAGGTAGSIVLAYRNKRLPVLNSKGGSLQFNLNGGAGGNGQAGQDGNNGNQGSRKTVRQNNDNDCSAWSGGWVKVWITPNKCYHEMRSDGRCKANDYASWDVYGTDGTPGSRGNDGGAGGRAGNGGLAIQADISAGRDTTATGSAGRAGSPGSGGSGGNGGKKGDTNYLRIDDAGSGSGKWCKIKHQQWESVNQWASNGGSGTTGGNTAGAVTPPSRLQLSDFTSYIRTYVSRCTSTANQVGDSSLRSFCTNVQSHFRV